MSFPARLSILHEDADLLVVNKPAGLVCHPTKGDAWSSLISRLRLHLPDTGVTLVHRLDRETSGVTVAVKSREAAAELGRLFQSRAVHKEYLAIVHGHPAAETFTIEAPLGPDPDSPVAIRDTVRLDGAPAATRFHVVSRFERRNAPFALLRAEPLTGRKHQIRIHLEHAGHPIVGDKIYGGDPLRYLRFVEGRQTDADRAALLLEFQALHAAALAFCWRDRDWRFEAPPEPAFAAFPRFATP
ncbi:MAG: RluA family pseudouridine synthase [Verrucomicrobiae bacterium]|nr:RluA family pseudouridine synthase [Verrucomicrobiae bacterium]